MTERLIMHLPSSTITIESDDFEKLSQLSSFLKDQLGAYHSTEEIDNLTVDDLSEEMSQKLDSLIFELGFI